MKTALKGQLINIIMDIFRLSFQDDNSVVYDPRRCLGLNYTALSVQLSPYV
ncbi:MAG: hypothetical protein HN704_04800 [Bacteroidetes bacterium]|nr:hypothetical protein [Bacteroidota bacterium]MBT6688042.1 hypothetical protein [Bacteroidota bacterium]MBT7145170.1 hypothetical protein [Bacteroidota bacterium]MBT7490910.1 hypothetical protein [Bacteroidota bacterium]